MPAGQDLLNANQRLHWAAKARITRQLRSDAFLLAKYHKVPHLERVHVFCVVEPDPRTRRRDPGNWSVSAKALVDGLVDAGVVDDDDSKHLVGPDMRLGKPHPGGRLVLIIRELPEESS
jgi:crossover junction endodeoxyribonuclease RusA